jgi:magnesium chelatase accessory protein
MLQRRHLSLDGLQVSFLEQGTATAGVPTLVLLHGLMGCADTFRPLIAALPESQHAIAIDFPGAGKSERKRGLDTSFEGVAVVVTKLLAALGLKDVCLAGHSHGGAIASRLAQTHPELVKQLVLLAPAHPYFVEANPLIRFYLSLPGRLFAYSMPWYPQWMQMMGLRRMAGPQSWDSVERLKPYRENLRTRGTISHLLNLLGTWQRDMSELSELLQEGVKQPVLLIWGDCDRAVPVHSASKLRMCLDDCEVQIMPGVGHRPAEEQPAAVAAMIASHLGHATARRYSPKLVASQDRKAPLMIPSFESGD